MSGGRERPRNNRVVNMQRGLLRENIESCTIITGKPNELVAQIHNRMPVILDYAGCDEWLECADRPSLERLLSPIPAQLLAAYPVSTAVNKPSQGGPGFIEHLGD